MIGSGQKDCMLQKLGGRGRAARFWNWYKRQQNMERYRSGHNGTDSKSVDGQPSVGSNPTHSATWTEHVIWTIDVRLHVLFFTQRPICVVFGYFYIRTWGCTLFSKNADFEDETDHFIHLNQWCPERILVKASIRQNFALHTLILHGDLFIIMILKADKGARWFLWHLCQNKTQWLNKLIITIHAR